MFLDVQTSCTNSGNFTLVSSQVGKIALVSSLVEPSFLSLPGFSFAVPHINNLYFLHLCKRYGMYNIIFFLLASKLVLSCGMLIIGSNFVWATCAFILRYVILNLGVTFWILFI